MRLLNGIHNFFYEQSGDVRCSNCLPIGVIALPFADPMVGIIRVGFVGHQPDLPHCPFADIDPDIRPRATVEFSAVSPTTSMAPLHLPMRMDI